MQTSKSTSAIAHIASCFRSSPIIRLPPVIVLPPVALPHDRADIRPCGASGRYPSSGRNNRCSRGNRGHRSCSARRWRLIEPTGKPTLPGRRRDCVCGCLRGISTS